MDFSNILDGIERNAEKAIPRSEEDYIVDGLLYCHKCNTPKQTRFTDFMGKVRTPYCLCKCAQEKRDAEERERQQAEFADMIKNLRRMGFPDSEMSQWRFERDDGANAKLSSVARKYVEHFSEMKEKGKGLLLFGTVGTGKTFAAACIANALIDKGYPCLVTNFARLTNTISGMYDGKQEYIDGLDRFDLLVIDDLASERDTEYMGEIVQNIIDARYRSGKPLIITTNLTGDELKNPADMRKQRIYSRLFEMCLPFEVKGADRRQKKLKKDFDELSDMLGL